MCHCDLSHSKRFVPSNRTLAVTLPSLELYLQQIATTFQKMWVLKERQVQFFVKRSLVQRKSNMCTDQYPYHNNA